MDDPLFDSLIFLLRYRRSPVEATNRFQSMMHDAELLPKLQAQLEVLLDAHGRFRDVIYDTQGIRDDGVDVAVRIPMGESEAAPRLIGFQVKSFDDVSKPEHMEKLKAQHSDAIRKVQGLDRYLIMLCTDMEKHRKKVRSVMQEFKSDPNTEVIEPQFAYTFLNHPRTRIDAIAARFVESSDLVFKEALAEITESDTPSARALHTYLVVEHVLTGKLEYDQRALLVDSRLERVYSELQEQNDEPGEVMSFDDQLAEDLEELETGGLSRDSDSGVFHLHLDQLRASTAVIATALARFRYSRSALFEYAFDLFGVRD